MEGMAISRAELFIEKSMKEKKRRWQEGYRGFDTASALRTAIDVANAFEGSEGVYHERYRWLMGMRCMKIM